VPDLPVVILTGRGDARDVVTGLGVGADDCMHKPIDGAVLLARITAVLRGHAAGRRST